MGAITEIPPDLVHQDWLRRIVSECKEINEVINETWNAAAAARSRRHAEKARHVTTLPGDLVLVHKPFYE